jgi:hypothetical protein
MQQRVFKKELKKELKKEPSREAGTFKRRIGSTVYRVGVHFSRTSKETANDKIIRLVKSEAAAGREVTQ